jgi:MYXO-CTERM domain-containing protein
MKDSSIVPGRNRRRAAVSAAALVVVSLGSSAALADQFVVVDSTWDHTPDLADSHYRVLPTAATPASWKSPVDYASGLAHVRLEVFTKPTATPTRFQVCFEATPTYACTDQSPDYTTVGVLDWETPFSNFWSPPGETVDWSQGTTKIALILKDTKNGKPSADNVGPEMAALYTPTHVRMVVTIVAPGSTYVPPPPVMMDGGVVDSDGGALVDGGTDDAGAVPATSSSSGTVDTSDAGADAGAGGSPSSPGKSEGGCSVAAAPGGARDTGWLALAMMAVGATRLRRRS